jgi:hypothetical protein
MIEHLGRPPGPNVAIAIPNRAQVSWLLRSGGRYVEIYLGGERTGGVFSRSAPTRWAR